MVFNDYQTALQEAKSAESRAGVVYIGVWLRW